MTKCQLDSKEVDNMSGKSDNMSADDFFKLGLHKTKGYTKYRKFSLTYKDLDQRIRNRMVRALGTNTRLLKTYDLLGCSLEEFKAYLEAKFQEGMTWDSYGRNGWHIDHIKPCKLFDLTTLEGQKDCFHYSNHQPLWEKDNCSKGAKYLI